MKLRNIIKNPIFVLIAIFIFALFLRVYLIPDNLFFGPEQGRDMLVVRDIVQNGNLTLIGPKTETEGIFYGPAYYYLMSIPYFFTSNPIFLSFFLIFLNTLGVFFIYLLGKELLGKRAGYIASLLYAVSFWVIVSDRWLSHPPLSITAGILFVYFLVRFVKGEKKSLIFSSVPFALAGQFQIFSYAILGAVLFAAIFLFTERFKKNFTSFLSFIVLAAIFSFVNILLFDVRHDFLISNNIMNFLTRQTGLYIPFSKSLELSISNFSYVLNRTIIPQSSLFSFFVFFVGGSWILSKWTKDKFAILILVWAFSPMIIFPLFRHLTQSHYFMSAVPAYLLLATFLINRAWIKKRFLGFAFMAVIVILNLSIWLKNIPSGIDIYFQGIQSTLKYKDQIKVVEHIYNKSNGSKFYYQAYTIPYWLPQAWDYLFWYYGKDNKDDSRINSKAKLLYVIIQDDPEHLFQSIWLRDVVSNWGKEQQKVRFGGIEVREVITLHEE